MTTKIQIGPASITIDQGLFLKKDATKNQVITMKTVTAVGPEEMEVFESTTDAFTALSEMIWDVVKADWGQV